MQLVIDSIDPKMPFLEEALDRVRSQEYVTAALSDRFENTQIAEVRLVRHKMGRRCAIAYYLENGAVAIGKARAKGLDRYSCELQRLLWEGGFDDRSADGISVPEVLGEIPEWEMWLQMKVPGRMATDLLAESQGMALAPKVAEAARKLHLSGNIPRRQQSMADELNILRDRLPKVAQIHPQWQGRIEAILDKCDRLGAKTPEFSPCGIHRDFYGDQIMVDGDRLYLIDLDLYCLGNPALDIGNFIAHITEYSLRVLGNPDALSDRETAITDRFVQFHGAGMSEAIAAYTTLTLVRHIYISTQIGDRRPFTEALLQLCEERL